MQHCRVIGNARSLFSKYVALDIAAFYKNAPSKSRAAFRGCSRCFDRSAQWSKREERGCVHVSVAQARDLLSDSGAGGRPRDIG
ncbi:hypothetical protein EVAR_5138_1 [Eumeta japonica]|uniref:Uncharacterized protein n=1 Tax=Eumeta variegata TaxID=151549 RepID=A0A4C1SXF1_EUMVA|nr:hypothetical protein EVAR_5138_1 [Eumeta japonica]